MCRKETLGVPLDPRQDEDEADVLRDLRSCKSSSV